jgi:transposase InsO family protein
MIPTLQDTVPAVSVRTICQLLGVSRSWYYAARQPSSRTQDDEVVIQRIEQIVVRHPGYGYRRVTVALQRQGVVINHKRVRRLMQTRSLLCAVRRYVRTTQSQHAFRRLPNLAKTHVPSGPNQLWVADLTYLHLARETGFLACILDAWSRKCIGWAVGADLTTALTVRALEQALRTRQPAPGWIHHSDQGVQYANHRYAELLTQNGAVMSMSATGQPTDNAIMESFFSTLKREEVWLTDYRDLAEARLCLHRFIDQIYNTERLHSSLDYQSPVAFELATR